MPNWCNNSLHLQHENPQMIERAAEAVKSGKLFSEFFPCPQELIDTVSGSLGQGTPEQAELELKQKENITRHGFSDWYSWSNANWGTKWEACEPALGWHDKNFITVSFDTAWSPPIAFYENLKDLGFIIKAYYYEGGCSFCGIWDHGDEQYYDIEGNSEWVMENIPSEIDLEFCISEGMADYEESEREEA